MMHHHWRQNGKGKEAISLAGQCWEHVPLEVFMLIPCCVSLLFPFPVPLRHSTSPSTQHLYARIYTQTQSQMQARTLAREKSRPFPFLPGCRQRQQLVPASRSAQQSDAPGRRTPPTHRAAERGCASPRPRGQLGGAARPTLGGARRQRLEQPGVDSRGCLPLRIPARCRPTPPRRCAAPPCSERGGVGVERRDGKSRKAAAGSGRG